jgi:predicted N-acetyltransferase YhbS
MESARFSPRIGHIDSSMRASFRRISIDEISAAHSAYVGVYEWLNAKGVRQWLRALSEETFAERQRDGQLFALHVDDRVAAVVTLAFEVNSYWIETIGDQSRWWIKSLAVVRAWRGEGVGKHVMMECEAVVRDARANQVFIDCVDGGFLPPYYAGLGYRAIAQKEITYPSGNTFPMVLMRKELNDHQGGVATGSRQV